MSVQQREPLGGIKTGVLNLADLAGASAVVCTATRGRQRGGVRRQREGGQDWRHGRPLGGGTTAAWRRAWRVQSNGNDVVQAKAINQSLSALGLCIHALTSKATHIPYRDSKLTFILRVRPARPPRSA
jgi:hypothetical protein